MAANGVPMTEPKAETSGKGRVPLVPIEILEDPYTPAAEVERIAADMARRGRGERTTCGKPT
jgi:hypothetical protein